MAVGSRTDDEPAAIPPVEDRNLRVVLEIERGGPCVMDAIEGDIVDLDVRLDQDHCNLDIAVRDEEESVSTKHTSNEICDHCPGVVFSEYGCLPRYLEVGDGEFVMETYVSDTETVAEIVAEVREICARVSVQSIVSTDGSEFRELCSVDVSELTAKQREAVNVAQELGYYDPDASVPMEKIADELGISLSATSQRLRRAESNVIRQLSCDCSCWET
ncbi:helix-turn-helix domain-containing protein [Natranaeroarchaeum sulfidigenes]|uniref:Transcriptional regulator, contains HTH domain n=1 Tax=Natranaeroarchaeum sulfidigenes TaxID=2784880 RepID=A0A897MTD3_9EURY|nr:helix-turn-helix domain-containing protein [Natranaeroarchaeum sulfidigenes]QSG02209.1 Transcriptional regulator, contains HTH domain [Natranaeroarchaeum sulfidigenes]